MRLQIILQLSPNPNIGSYLGNIPDVFLPVLWFDAEAVITDTIADQLKMIGKHFDFSSSFNTNVLFVLEFLPYFAEVFGILSVILGICIILVLLVLHRRKGNQERKPEKQESSKPKC